MVAAFSPPEIDAKCKARQGADYFNRRGDWAPCIRLIRRRGCDWRNGVASIVGTDIAHAVPLTLVAGTGHWLTGSVDASMLLSLLMGSIPGIVLGSYLAPRIPEQGLRYLLAIVLMIVGIRLISS